MTSQWDFQQSKQEKESRCSIVRLLLTGQTHNHCYTETSVEWILRHIGSVTLVCGDAWVLFKHRSDGEEVRFSCFLLCSIFSQGNPANTLFCHQTNEIEPNKNKKTKLTFSFYFWNVWRRPVSRSSAVPWNVVSKAKIPKEKNKWQNSKNVFFYVLQRWSFKKWSLMVRYFQLKFQNWPTVASNYQHIVHSERKKTFFKISFQAFCTLSSSRLLPLRFSSCLFYRCFKFAINRNRKGISFFPSLSFFFKPFDQLCPLKYHTHYNYEPVHHIQTVNSFTHTCRKCLSPVSN